MLDKKLLSELEQYINEHLFLELVICKSSEPMEENLYEDLHYMELDDFIKNNRKATLQKVLFGFIDKKGVSDPDVYKRAGVDRKLFSKIRSNPEYRPSKNTIIALAFGLELNEEEFDQLLESGGYSLSESDTSDLVIKFCLEKKIYDVFQVNEYLDYFSQKTLTGSL
jgi:hypothetical protein